MTQDYVLQVILVPLGDNLQRITVELPEYTEIIAVTITPPLDASWRYPDTHYAESLD
jgi:hypothetical protein